MNAKPFLPLALCVCLLARADTPIKPGEENPQTYTLDKFAKEIAASRVEGKLVRLKFDFRSSDLTKGLDGGKDGTIFSASTGDSLEVLVPPEGTDWFRRIPISGDYNSSNPRTFLVYGIVIVDSRGRPFVQLVGTEVRHDDLGAGDVIFWH